VDTILTIISELDTILVNGVQLKQWHTIPVFQYYEDSFEPYYSDYGTIVENIGSLNGPAGTSQIFIAEGCQPLFVCYDANGFQLINNYFDSCNAPSSINNLLELKIGIYPNPTIDIFQVESEDITGDQAVKISIIFTQDKLLE